MSDSYGGTSRVTRQGQKRAGAKDNGGVSNVRKSRSGVSVSIGTAGLVFCDHKLDWSRRCPDTSMWLQIMYGKPVGCGCGPFLVSHRDPNES